MIINKAMMKGDAHAPAVFFFLPPYLMRRQKKENGGTGALYTKQVNRKAMLPDWFATLFAIFIGSAVFILFAFLSYGGQQTITHTIEDQRLFFDVDEDLRIMLQSALSPNIGQASEAMNQLLGKRATFADLIDMIGYDTKNREAYLSLLRGQASVYLYRLSSPTNYEIMVYYSQQPPGGFLEPTGYGLCYGAAFCVFSNELKGETVVGKVDYPSIKQGQVITVSMVRAKQLSERSEERSESTESTAKEMDGRA